MLGYVSPAFEYVAAIEQWFWPVVAIVSALGLLFVAGKCA